MTALLTLITIHQSSTAKAEAFADKAVTLLGNGATVKSVGRYTKFENSYKIEIEISAEGTTGVELTHFSVRMTSKIAAPWLVYYNPHDDIAEFIFNKDENSVFPNQAFNVLFWANWQIT